MIKKPNTDFPRLAIPFMDDATGMISQVWLRFLSYLFDRVKYLSPFPPVTDLAAKGLTRETATLIQSGTAIITAIAGNTSVLITQSATIYNASDQTIFIWGPADGYFDGVTPLLSLAPASYAHFITADSINFYRIY